ncbi:FAD-dependent oxidoreductase [Klenkia terrae]|uniref:FAD-dependent oxidoreductase n=1 Tax=Klenkia terrae TaxID=1052259 RepID=UPI00360DE9E2
MVIATPFNTWRNITLEPALPSRRAAAVARGHACRGLKLIIHVTGVPAGLSCTGDGVFPTVYDYMATPDGGRFLVAFTDSDSFDPTDEVAVAAAVHHYVPEAVVHGVEYHDWAADPLFGGPWVSPYIGQFSQIHKGLGEPHGRVHFIGSDVSLQFPGYIEGALETADNAVTSILSGAPERPGPAHHA